MLKGLFGLGRRSAPSRRTSRPQKRSTPVPRIPASRSLASLAPIRGEWPPIGEIWG